MSQTLNAAIAVVGIDIGKNSFHIVGHTPITGILAGCACAASGHAAAIPPAINSRRRMAHPAPVEHGIGGITALNGDVRFTPESGHSTGPTGCPLCANRWGNRPAGLLIAEDFGCCASG